MEQINNRLMTGKTVLVTGGTGRATALGLAMMGAYVAITGRDRARTEDAARARVRTGVRHAPGSVVLSPPF